MCHISPDQWVAPLDDVILGRSLNSVLNVKALVGAFNPEKALVGAFSVNTNLCVDHRLKLYFVPTSTS